jgi:DMSO/TMAO reductase YedYZ molybdopterin-dependent catalytic subunit
MLTRGFFGSQRPQPPREIPPGQYYETGFPTLTVGPTPRIDTADWSFELSRGVGPGASPVATWDWNALMAMPQEEIRTDLHCVTKWSKLDTHWKGVSFDKILEAAGDLTEEYVMISSYGGYTTNLPLDDVTDGKAWIAWEFEGEPLDPGHGGPARMLVPHLYLWKSAKWVNGVRLMDEDSPGFWEAAGYHMRGDPWHEERYWGD